MKPKPYLVWSKREIDLSDPWQRKWTIQQVLIHGKEEDVGRTPRSSLLASLPAAGMGSGDFPSLPPSL